MTEYTRRLADMLHVSSMSDAHFAHGWKNGILVSVAQQRLAIITVTNVLAWRSLIAVEASAVNLCMVLPRITTNYRCVKALHVCPEALRNE
ncbi:MAG: hypothetical protein E6R03_07800 [Hyphomicrobiaceae bacterium]|nr:MAG: hypothetical protein E6R03_07800 [Hyphomicrobiaceae bacterium]